MAVVDSTGKTPETRSSAGRKQKGIGAWVKKNKAMAALIGGGGVLLLMSHKGSGGATSETEALTKAAEQEAQTRAAIEAGSTPAAVPANEGGGGSGSSGAATGTTPVPAAEADPALTAAVSQIGTEVGELTAAQKAAAESGPASASTVREAEEAAYNRGVAKVKANTTAAAKKKAAKPEVAKVNHGAGQTVNGRFFAGATGYTLGPVIRNSKGETHRTVTVKYGGRTETLVSHNGGRAWTDNAPGHTPPSRGAPKHTQAPKPATVHRAPAKRKPTPKRPSPKRKG